MKTVRAGLVLPTHASGILPHPPFFRTRPPPPIADHSRVENITGPSWIGCNSASLCGVSESQRAPAGPANWLPRVSGQPKGKRRSSVVKREGRFWACCLFGVQRWSIPRQSADRACLPFVTYYEGAARTRRRKRDGNPPFILTYFSIHGGWRERYRATCVGSNVGWQRPTSL